MEEAGEGEGAGDGMLRVLGVRTTRGANLGLTSGTGGTISAGEDMEFLREEGRVRRPMRETDDVFFWIVRSSLVDVRGGGVKMCVAGDRDDWLLLTKSERLSCCP